MLIAVKQLFAEADKRHTGNTVVLKDDTLVAQRESPFLRVKVRGVTASILRLVVTLHVTLPVYLLVAHHLSAGFDASHILWSTGAVLIEIQL